MGKHSNALSQMVIQKVKLTEFDATCGLSAISSEVEKENKSRHVCLFCFVFVVIARVSVSLREIP